jgi:copper chaperone
MSQPTRRETMQVFKVTGMTCAHCERAVVRAIQTLDPAAKVQVDLQQGRVEVESLLNEQTIREAISDEGYGVE